MKKKFKKKSHVLVCGALVIRWQQNARSHYYSMLSNNTISHGISNCHGAISNKKTPHKKGRLFSRSILKCTTNKGKSTDLTEYIRSTPFQFIIIYPPSLCCKNEVTIHTRTQTWACQSYYQQNYN